MSKKSAAVGTGAICFRPLVDILKLPGEFLGKKARRTCPQSCEVEPRKKEDKEQGDHIRRSASHPVR
jgi:hypothetical protein